MLFDGITYEADSMKYRFFYLKSRSHLMGCAIFLWWSKFDICFWKIDFKPFYGHLEYIFFPKRDNTIEKMTEPFPYSTW